MASQSFAAGRKRRADGPLHPRSAPKRRKPDISVQDGHSGEINIASFVKAREFEIKALESNMQAMRKSLSSRAFQQLPRHMRRRTASHNVKKVPRRLRKRAVKEMKDDNTPTVNNRTKAPSRKLRLRLATAKSLKKTNRESKRVRHKKKKQHAGAEGKDADRGQDPENRISLSRVPRVKKNVLARPPTATTKYKRRQASKTWLPTHLWHAKRAQMTRPTEPLWRLAIPLRPTDKSYRPTHRAAGSRGCIAWDVSYMSTVACVGTEHTLENMLGALNFGPAREKASKTKRWKSGVRFAEGYLHQTGATKRLLGPGLVMWVPVAQSSLSFEERRNQDSSQLKESFARRRKVRLDRRILIRVHPSFFKDFWVELLRAAKMQKPQVLVEDLRFEIGGIHVTGPASTEALLGVLCPRNPPTESDVAAKTWTSLAGLSNAGALPRCALLSIDIVDPRLSHPPKRVHVPSDQQSLDKITELVATWPADEGDQAMLLASHKARWTAATRLPTQKSINRRRAEAGAGNTIPVLDKDPPIPAVLLAHRAPGTDSNAQGSWTVILPWCCVDAVWRSLQYYPISSGSTPRFGGLYQSQQLSFEQMTPWFPADMPGTEAGKAWERTESEKRFDAWLRRPPGRRLQWDLVDIGLGRKGELGRGWMCDWEYLFKDTNPGGPTSGAVQATAQEDQDMTDDDEKIGRRRNTSSPESTPEPEPVKNESDPEFCQLGPHEAAVELNPRKHKVKFQTNRGDLPAIATVRIRLLMKGTPLPGARIYRLPPITTPSPTALEALPIAQTTAPTSSLPASVEAHASTNPSNTPPSALPAAQHTLLPPPSSQTSSAFASPLTNSITSLRNKWLSLLPAIFDSRYSRKPLSAKNSRPLPYHHPASTDTYAVSKINVFPKNASPSLIDKFSTHPSEERIAEFEDQQLLRELLKNDAVGLSGPNGKAVQWDVKKGLVECPDKENLIGFVTSGGYNLAEGRGTAVGGVWVQRVKEGWKKEEDEEGEDEEEMTVMMRATADPEQRSRQVAEADGDSGRSRPRGSAEKAKINGAIKGKDNRPTTEAIEVEKLKASRTRRRIKERTLCVVRNAGSGVGRLGWWEVCE